MILLVSISLIYGALGILGHYKIWKKRSVVKPVGFPKGVSIVIAVRNEESNIPRLIASLLKLKIPFNFEIILINDNSTDASLQLLKETEDKHAFIHVLNTKKEGKKAAVKLAVEAAKYPVICQTDADCTVNEFWVMSSITKLFSEETNLVLGPVYPFKTKRFLNGLIRLEWLAMQFITVLTARLKKPGMANGANMTFYKKEYLNFCDSNLGHSYASGDDMFFLQFLQEQGKTVSFNLDQKAIIKTEMPNSFTALLKQRIRWATKAGKTTNGLIYFFSLIVTLANFAWIGAIFSDLNKEGSFSILLIAIGSKIGTDYMICFNMAKFHKDLKVLKFIPLLFLFYPLYLLLGFVLSFKRTYAWKGRSVR